MSINHQIPLSKRVADNWPYIIKTLLPDFTEAMKKLGNHVACPIHSGKDGFRFFEDFEKTGGGICNSCGAFPNGFKLIEWALKCSPKEAREKVSGILKKIQTKPKITIKKRRKPKLNISGSNKKIENARYQKFMTGCSPDNIVKIKKYLKERGLDGKVPQGFLFNPKPEYRQKIDDRWQVLDTYPAMVAPIILENKKVGISITYLNSKGDGKAPVDSPRKQEIRLEGDTLTGGAIHLANVEENVPLVLSEGIETGLAVQQATGWSAWACTSAQMLMKVIVPDSDRKIYIAADLDQTGRGQNACQTLARRLASAGIKVFVVLPDGPIPPNSKSIDWLDVLNQKGADHVLEAFKKCEEFKPGPGDQLKKSDIDFLFSKHKLDEISCVSDSEEVSKRLRGFALDTKGLETIALGFAKGRLRKILNELQFPEPARHLNHLYDETDEEVGEASGGILSFDEIEPWSSEIDGEELLDELISTCNRHVILPSHAAEAMALWIVFSWSIDAFQIAPNLVFYSPVKGCGKTTALTLLMFLCPRCLPASNCTPAALFRSVQVSCPTLLIDEADQYTVHTDEITQIINSSHNRSHAFTVRVVGENFEARTFKTWCPKAIARIGRMKPPLEDRSIIIDMIPKKRDEKIIRLKNIQKEAFTSLKQKVLRWVQDNMNALEGCDPLLPEGLRDRAQDNWASLISIADLAGGEWPKRAREAALGLSLGKEKLEGPLRLLQNIKEIFEKEDSLKMGTQELIGILKEDHGWSFLSEKKMAQDLKKFLVAPTRWKDKNKRDKRGYTRDLLTDAWERFL